MRRTCRLLPGLLLRLRGRSTHQRCLVFTRFSRSESFTRTFETRFLSTYKLSTTTAKDPALPGVRQCAQRRPNAPYQPTSSKHHQPYALTPQSAWNPFKQTHYTYIIHLLQFRSHRVSFETATLTQSPTDTVCHRAYTHSSSALSCIHSYTLLASNHDDLHSLVL